MSGYRILFTEPGKGNLTLIYWIFCYSCFQESKDLKMKADMVRKLMEKGYRVKVLTFRMSYSSNYFTAYFALLCHLYFICNSLFSYRIDIGAQMLFLAKLAQQH